MKRIAVIAFLITGTVFFTAQAQSEAGTTRTPVANAKQVNQTARIVHGQANGELTRHEARMLKKEQRHIRRVKRRSKADGVVTAEERAMINRKQRRANRHIRRQKHDAQKKY